MNRRQEIEARLAAIRQDIETRGDSMNEEELAKLEEEVKKLTEERKQLEAAAERRNGLLSQIAGGAGTAMNVGQPSGAEGTQSRANDDPASSPEYRSAWLKNIRGIPMDEAERRAWSSATTGSGPEVIPTQTQNAILRKVREYCGILEDITLLHVAGYVRFAVEGTVSAAVAHTENATITPGTDTVVNVELHAFELVKLIQISDTVRTMSIDAFEEWIADILGEKIAEGIEEQIFNGSGSGQGTGINNSQTWGASNSVTVARTASLTADNVRALIALLPAGYDPAAVFYMSKKTLFTDFLPLEDDSKNKIVTVEGRNYFVYGYPVKLTNRMIYHEALLGAPKKVVGNLPENLTMHQQYDIKTNSYFYSGVAMFDCKLAIEEAFVKLNKATA